MSQYNSEHYYRIHISHRVICKYIDEIKTYEKFNLSTDQGIMSLLQYLRKIKVEDTLEQMGVKEGDTVIIGEFEFTYHA